MTGFASSMLEICLLVGCLIFILGFWVLDAGELKN